MTSKMRWLALIGLIVLAYRPAQAQNAELDARIREEGMNRSQVMQTLHHLTDVYGPRLTGSPGLERAGAWTLEQLAAWGLENAHAEPWDWGRPGWANERLSVHLVEPVKEPLVAEVLAWTPGTNGPVRAEVVHLAGPEHPTEAALTAYLDSLRGRLSGRIVLVGPASVSATRYDLPHRYDDQEMHARYDPYSTTDANPTSRSRTEQPELPEGVLSPGQVSARLEAFLATENDYLVRVNPSGMPHGLIRAFADRRYDPAVAKPTIILRTEDFGRIARLIANGHTVELEIDIVNQVYPEGRTAYNYIADFTGTDKADELVIIGGHLDSWHAATGATDNAAGVAVMMEAVRILKAVGATPRRTIRVALWTGEEQGLLGSQAYVAEHFGTAENPKPAHARLSAYLNLDSGTGRIRGATVFGPPEAAEVLEAILAPFEDLGVAGARPTNSRRLGGSDHTSFNVAGLPGVGLGQDPIEYFDVTWHTNVDTYERILEEDLKQAAVVVATMALHLANRDELLPRFSLEDLPPAP